MPDHVNWDLYFKVEQITSVFEPSEIVYLSPDSENLLDEIDDSKVYVIGGIIDHDVISNVSLDFATKNKIQTARLPIKENIELFNASTVLTVNQVFDILVSRQQGLAWTDIFEEHLPKRKLMK